MRDPNRIDDFCNELAKMWHVVPDLRFGQMMCNIIDCYNASKQKDVFFAEDDELLKFIKDFFVA